MKLLTRNPPQWEPEPKENNLLRGLRYALLIAIVITMLLMLRGCDNPAWAETIEGHDVQEWATAIGKAENSHKYPYGILRHYKHTTARQACINTVRHYFRDWRKLTVQVGLKQPFLSYLQEHYAPLHVSNDPNGLNRFWISNVQFFLNKEI